MVEVSLRTKSSATSPSTAPVRTNDPVAARPSPPLLDMHTYGVQTAVTEIGNRLPWACRSDRAIIMIGHRGQVAKAHLRVAIVPAAGVHIRAHRPT